MSARRRRNSVTLSGITPSTPASMPKHQRQQRNWIRFKKQQDPDLSGTNGILFRTTCGVIVLGILLQYLLAAWTTWNPRNYKQDFWHNYGLLKWYIPLAIVQRYHCGVVYKKTPWTQWLIKNAIHIDDDMEDHDGICPNRRPFGLTVRRPDVGIRFWRPRLSPHEPHYGVKQGDRKLGSVYDKTVDGFIKQDEDGNIVYETKPCLMKSWPTNCSATWVRVPRKFRIFYDARDYDFSEKDRKTMKRIGEYSRMGITHLQNVINNNSISLTPKPTSRRLLLWPPTRGTILIATVVVGSNIYRTAFDVWTRRKTRGISLQPILRIGPVRQAIGGSLRFNCFSLKLHHYNVTHECERIAKAEKEWRWQDGENLPCRTMAFSSDPYE